MLTRFSHIYFGRFYQTVLYLYLYNLPHFQVLSDCTAHKEIWKRAGPFQREVKPLSPYEIHHLNFTIWCSLFEFHHLNFTIRHHHHHHQHDPHDHYDGRPYEREMRIREIVVKNGRSYRANLRPAAYYRMKWVNYQSKKNRATHKKAPFRYNTQENVEIKRMSYANLKYIDHMSKVLHSINF